MLFRSLLCALTAALAFSACRPKANDKLHVITHQLENAALPDGRKLQLILQADSLVGATGNDSIRLVLHKKAGEVYLNMADAQNAKVHFLLAVAIARKINDQQNLAAALNNTGIAYDDLFETDSAIKYYTAAATLYRTAPDSLRLAQTLVNIGILYKNKGEHEKAVTTTTEAAGILEHFADKRSLSDAYTTLGNSLKALNRMDLALFYHQKALQIRQAGNDSVGIAGSLNNIGNIYRYQKKYAKALEQYAASLTIKERSGTQRSIANTIDNIAAVYLEQQNFTLAKQYFAKALAIRKATGDKDGILTTMNRLCTLLIETNDLKAAETLAKEADTLSRHLGYLKQRIDNTGVLTEIYSRSGRQKEALAYALQELQLKDSLFNLSTAQATAEAETRFRTLEKEHQLTFVNALKDRQVTEIKTQQVFIIILACLLALLLLSAFLLAKAKNKVNLLFKELSHRVENNLQILLGVIVLKKYATQDTAQRAIVSTIEDRVNAMISIHHILKAPAFNKHLRIDMNRFITDLVTNIDSTFSKEHVHFTLRKEIAAIRCEAKQAVTIGLLINEILTNIYKHGKPLNSSGEINISLRSTGKKYQLSISDNCAPWEPARGKERKGMGLFLIETLSDQLKGKLKTESNDAGTTTALLF